MRDGSVVLTAVLADGGFSTWVEVDVLHGTDPVASGVVPESWSLVSNLGNDPKTTGRVRVVHESEAGESWVPRGAGGVLSPFRATLQLTMVVQAGVFVERTPLGLFDVVAVPSAEDTHTGGQAITVTSTVDVDVESLDGRVLGAGFRSPLTRSGGALTIWREVGVLPVLVSGAAVLPLTTWPAEDGSRLDAVQDCARALGGVPVVDSGGAWVLVGDTPETVVLYADGDQSTVLTVDHQVSLDEFANVVVGTYETETGFPLRSVAVATGLLSPESMGREIVAYHSSDKVRTQTQADQAAAAELSLRTSREVDVPVVCVVNPLVEIGDRVVVEGWVRPLQGVCQRVELSDAATMTVTVRTRETL